MLAKGRYAVGAGEKGTVVLKATRTGKKALKKVKKAKLKLGRTTKKVSLR